MKSILFGLLLGILVTVGAAAAQDAMGGQDTMGGQDVMGGGAAVAGEADAGARTVSVTITNTTAHQAFSAPVVVSHDRAYAPFALGEPAYPELVPLAEDGMTAELLTVARVDPAILDLAVASGPLGPGDSVTLQLRVDEAHPLLSAFGMMVSTNDTVFSFGTDLAMAAGTSSGSGAMASGGGAMGSDGTGSEGMDSHSEGMDSSGMDASGMDSTGMGSDGMASESSAASGAMGSDSTGAPDMAADSMGSSGDAMTARVDLYDGTVRALDAGSEANTESCHDVPGPPCGSVGVRHPVMAEGAVAVSHGLTGAGDLDPAVYGWQDPVAEVTVSAP